ncbi:MAG: hypothetical protein ACREQ5_35265, partial [Candidatus Dormibacteria bacterium]
MQTAPDIAGYRRHWAERFGTAPFLPMSRAEMELLGWDSCDVIIVTGDAYVDHPSFGMAIIGRVLEAQGFRVGMIAQPDWHRPDDITDLRGTVFARKGTPAGWIEIDSTHLDAPGPLNPPVDPYAVADRGPTGAGVPADVAGAAAGAATPQAPP